MTDLVADMARNTVDGRTAPDQQPRRRSTYERLANAASTFRPIQPKQSAQSAIEEVSRREQAEAIVKALPKLRRRGPQPRQRIPQRNGVSSTGGLAGQLIRPQETAGYAHLAGESSPRLLVQTACEEADQRQRRDEATDRKQPHRQGKRSRHPGRDETPRKRNRGGTRGQRRQEFQTEDLASVLRYLEEEFAMKARLSHEKTWCTPIPHERKVSTVRDFYKAFHDASTLPTQTCMLCYRKRTKRELRQVNWERWSSDDVQGVDGSVFSCPACFSIGESVPVCAECVRCFERGGLSPAAKLHSRLGCEHVFPDELKGLTPIEEKLIGLNSCYGHVRGHITVFPNNVQELVTKVLPHPLVQVMDEIHISWQGAERPGPSDLSSLLSVRRQVVERALSWLKKNNHHYEDVEIDMAEMESWGSSPHGVPPVVYDRMEPNEPSAWERSRTAQVVPPAERAMDDESPAEIEEILTQLYQGQDATDSQSREHDGIRGGETDARGDAGSGPDGKVKKINEVTSSALFLLEGPPVVSDAEKLRFAWHAVGGGREENDRPGPKVWIKSAESRQGGDASEPYIHVCRGDEFADSLDAWFFAKTFPTLFPFGFGGPRLAEEAIIRPETAANSCGTATRAETAVRDLLSSRNMSLRTWAGVVLRRHGGRFATHNVFSFLVFNMGVRSRNRRISMLSATRKNFRKVECIVQSLTIDRLVAARAELESSGKTTDVGVKELLRCCSLYGYRQPMSRELRLSMRRKIQSLIVYRGIPAIWFTLNPNDITNPVKLRLAAYRTRDPKEAEAFLTSLDAAYKRTRLAISDPLSSAEFFHREMTLFFEHYVKVGEESVFGRISHYYGAVETNERGALHVHGLLWLHGNAYQSSMLGDIQGEDQETYRERIVKYVDSVFSEDLDEEGFCAIQAERSITSDISQLLRDNQRFSASFDEEANFCAGATQIHTHSPTCVKYPMAKGKHNGSLCRFKAPWGLVDKTAFTGDGVLRIRRSHSMVNRWNKAIAVGLRHNHDISFIATQRKTMALVFYVTNYATKVEDPARGDDMAGDDNRQNKTRQFLMKVANRVFTERPLSQVEVVADLLGYPTELTNNSAWAFLNVSVLYWQVFRQWPHLRAESGAATAEGSVDESILVEEAGQRICRVEAYCHRGDALRRLCLYDYVSLVMLKRIDGNKRQVIWGEVPFESGWAPGRRWVQVLRRPGKQAIVCLDGYLSKDFDDDDEGSCHRRAAVQHLALFVPWQSFVDEESGDINCIWARARAALTPRISCFVDNVQLLRRSAEDAKRDAKQWAATSSDGDFTAVHPEEDGAEQAGEYHGSVYQADRTGNTMRLVDVVRSAIGMNQITTGSSEITAMMQELSHFQQSPLSSSYELQSTIIPEPGPRRINIPGRAFSGATIPLQTQVRAIKSQQICASREKEKMIQGIQSAAVQGELMGIGEDDIQMTGTDFEQTAAEASTGMQIRFGASTSFLEAGKTLVARLTLNKRQAIALLIICRQLDLIRCSEKDKTGQLCQFIGGEGGTGKSRVIQALVELFKSKEQPNRVLITATSGTAAARIDGITIHSACGFSKDVATAAHMAKNVDGVRLPKQAERFVDGQSRMDWQDKDVLVIDEVSMLGARTLHAVNEKLCKLRGSQQDFGGIPIVLFCGDFLQFRPVQERSILLPSTAVSWDVDNSFKAEQRHQHDKAHALWKKFTTVIMLDEQVRAAGDPELQRLLKRIRLGVQDHTDLDLLNSRCYQEGRRIPWETGITVVTPLNRNRWNLNMEASLAFRIQQRSTMRIFMSEHKWKGGLPTEEEATMMLNQGDDSAIPVPAVFIW
ncbi:ATP-dependent DNA helicase PIF1 [Metarhizium robertsii ARSEF 23]|uniref:ATP-dependent DNA helicase n=1 Tax=Metarhizium robertsii (strain ARSEF 23 / ATCC MYA-3075) TaxID=655844 RepID=E9FCZ9_METRA|nr:ATP-dependent DNA helicase PIF1 [Metarhizium robertsii ARSEF 23]EFY94377.2 ATP-dependent DNA helicase PIF1 [Metarhizium robertsii ARSEF 23]